MRAFMLAGCALLLLAARPASSVTYHVFPDGSGAFPTIQAAIDAAAAGDTVLAASGVYEQAIQETAWGSSMLVLKPGITLRGEAGPEGTVVSSGGQGRVMVGASLDPPAVVEGFTISGGVAPPDWAWGGGVLVDGGSIELTDCHVLRNRAEYGGGAFFYSPTGAAPVVRNCRFSGNVASAGHGGGVYVEGMSAGASPAFLDCVFDSNAATVGGFGAGGAICVDALSGSTSIEGCSFGGNSSAWRGGALTVRYYTSQGQCEVIGSNFISNVAVAGGGGAWIGENGSTRFAECRFTDNAVVSGNPGGALFLESTTAMVESCVMTGNHAGSGGAICGSCALRSVVVAGNHATVAGGGIAPMGDLVASACTIVGNSAPDGAAIGSGNGRVVALDHTVIAFNAGSAAISCDVGVPPSTVTATCADVYGNTDGDWTGCLAGLENSNGNFSADPLFCDRTGMNYTLRLDSRCLPAHNDCQELIGALGQGCGPVVVEPRSWASIKALYR